MQNGKTFSFSDDVKNHNEKGKDKGEVAIINAVKGNPVFHLLCTVILLFYTSFHPFPLSIFISISFPFPFPISSFSSQYTCKSGFLLRRTFLHIPS